MSITATVTKCHCDPTSGRGGCRMPKVLGNDKYSAVLKALPENDDKKKHFEVSLISSPADDNLVKEMAEWLNKHGESSDHLNTWVTIKNAVNVIFNIIEAYPSIIDPTKTDLTLGEAIDLIINALREELAKRDAQHEATKTTSVDPPALMSFRRENIEAISKINSIKNTLQISELLTVKLVDVSPTNAGWGMCSIQ